ncbi:MAG TPA: thioredoxin family protein [Bacteroidota bacterium]|nr:thioredoxin family protein [Bacteroidota bacterium]
MRRLFILVAALVVSIAIASSPSVEIGKAVPEFSLTDINGKTVKLSDYKGKVVVLEWTNPNCPFVQRVYRSGIMTSVQKKYADKVIWLTVNSTNPKHQDFETAEDLKKTYTEWKATFVSMLLDPEGKIGKMFDAKTTPHMYIIDKTGTLVYAGAIDDDPRGSKSEKTNYVDAALQNLLDGKPIPVSTTKPYGCTVKYSP